MIRLWRRLRAASPPDRALAAEALALLVTARLLLWCLPFPLARRALRRYARTARGGSAVHADRVAWAFAAAARRLPGPFRDCLPQALAAEALLTRHGVPVELRIGVRSGHGGRAVEAHAWVSSDDHLVAGSLADLSTYTQLGSGGDASWSAGPAPSWDDVLYGSQELLDLCRAEEISALLYHRMRGTPAFASWPPAVRNALEHDAQAAVARELLIRRELLRVLDALNARGVRPVILKGTALAYSVYPHPSLRSRSDTDLLIRQADAVAVQEALLPLGYTRSLLCDGELLFRQFELARDDEFGVSHALDFHWGISAQTAFAATLEYQEVAARAIPAPSLGPHALVPSTVDALLLALMHPAMHHRNQWRLLWAYDVHLLASALNQDGFGGLVRQATARRVAAVCEHGLRRARDWFGTAIPQAMLDQLGAVPLDHQPTAAYLAASRSWVAEAAASVRALPSWRSRLRLLREIALPSPGYLLRSYGMSPSGAHQALLPALYVHRGVRGAWRVLMRRK